MLTQIISTIIIFHENSKLSIEINDNTNIARIPVKVSSTGFRNFLFAIFFAPSFPYYKDKPFLLVCQGGKGLYEWCTNHILSQLPQIIKPHIFAVFLIFLSIFLIAIGFINNPVLFLFQNNYF